MWQRLPLLLWFYSEQISLSSLLVVTLCIPVLFIMNRKRVLQKSTYVMVGLVVWTAMLKSGVHATLAGVLLAMFIPIRRTQDEASPLHEFEYDLHTAVAFIILPLFAFANAGISLQNITLSSLLHPISLGITLGLFLGKQIGILLFCWLGVIFRIAQLPSDLSWRHIYGSALLCGIGFTMSLFISSLAFQETGVTQLYDERLGIMIGSLLSAIAGYSLLRVVLAKPSAKS